MRKTPTARCDSLLRMYALLHRQQPRGTAAVGWPRVAQPRHFPSPANAHIRQYRRVFLSPYYRSRRTCVPLSSSSETFAFHGERRGEGDDARVREIEFLGCILKSLELSGMSEAKVQGKRYGPGPGFSFCMSILPDLSFSPLDLFITGTSGSPFIFHRALWPRVTRITMPAHL